MIRGMYFWKSNPELNPADVTFLGDAGIRNYYVRFFDVGWDEVFGPVPKGEMNSKNRSEYHKQVRKYELLENTFSDSSNCKVVPVIYIENEVMERIKVNDIPSFCDKMTNKIMGIWEIEFNGIPFSEIQFDCDWTINTKGKYFLFLEQFEKKNPLLKLTATIRLHQIKFQEKTGVPPVSKGILMYYNMGRIKDEEEGNSILNNQTGSRYINKKSDYPIPLDLALPVYSWSVWFREGVYENILYSINENNIDKLDCFKSILPNHYRCEVDTLIDDNYFRVGDVLRLEKQDLKNIEKAKKICAPLLNDKEVEIILFSYSPENTQLLYHEKLDAIYSFD